MVATCHLPPWLCQELSAGLVEALMISVPRSLWSFWIRWYLYQKEEEWEPPGKFLTSAMSLKCSTQLCTGRVAGWHCRERHQFHDVPKLQPKYPRKPSRWAQTVIKCTSVLERTPRGWSLWYEPLLSSCFHLLNLTANFYFFSHVNRASFTVLSVHIFLFFTILPVYPEARGIDLTWETTG